MRVKPYVAYKVKVIWNSHRPEHCWYSSSTDAPKRRANSPRYIYIYIRMSFTIKTLFNLPWPRCPVPLGRLCLLYINVLLVLNRFPNIFHWAVWAVSPVSGLLRPPGDSHGEMSVSTSLIESTVHFYTQKSATWELGYRIFVFIKKTK